MAGKLSPGVVFVGSLVVLGLLTLGDLAFLSGSERSGYDIGEFTSTESRAIYAKSVVALPGDRLVVRPDLGLGASPRYSSAEFYIVPGGDRYALLDGEAPRSTYAHVPDIATNACCAHDWMSWTRPDDELAHRAPREPIETGPGIEVDMRELVLSIADHPDRVDLVWVLTPNPAAKQPATPEERRAADSQTEQALGARFSFHPAFAQAYPTVFPAAFVTWHPVLFVSMGLAAATAAGAAVAWVVQLRRRTLREPAPGAEGLLQLHASAGQFLASLRGLLVGSFVALLLVALHVALLGEPDALYQLAGVAGIAAGPRLFLGATVAALYVAVAAAWALTLWHVHRLLARWRRRAATAPLELDDAVDG